MIRMQVNVLHILRDNDLRRYVVVVDIFYNLHYYSIPIFFRKQRADLYRANLRWLADDALLIGWADNVKLARVKLRTDGTHRSGKNAPV
jgi:hypothetical protein